MSAANILAHLGSAHHVACVLRDARKTIAFEEKEKIHEFVNQLVRVTQEIPTTPMAPLSAPVDRGPEKKSCNRHSDCDAADAKAKERFEANRKLPYSKHLDFLQPYAEHCHDDCCEDCLGS